MSVENKIAAARTRLVLDQPFFGVLALGLQVKLDPTCKTAWVDGRTVGFNPAYVEGLDFDETTGLIAHEVMHPALGHTFRRDNRDPKLWNIACDAAINEQLVNAGFKLPEGGVMPTPEESGKSAEWIYSHRQQQQQPDNPQPDDEQDEDEGEGTGGQPGDEPSDDGGDDGDESGEGPGGEESFDEVRDAPTGTDEDGTEAPTEQDWKERTAAAALQAEAMGKMPGGMKLAVERALKPRVDVRSVLLRFFQDRAASDYSWMKANTRYMAQGLYLPGLQSHALGEVAVMVDTSGSMNNEASLGRARALVESVLEECNPAGVELVFADAEVNHTQRIERGEPLTWEPQGGGGTDFRPALQHIDEAGHYVCAICITDLYGTFPDVPPDVPVLWLSTTERLQAPFGETVYIDE